MAANNFPLDEAQIVALFMESVFYGIYLVSFVACVRSLFSGAGVRANTKESAFLVAILLGIFATLDIAFGLRRVLVAFIWYHGPGGAIKELEDISYWVDVMKLVTWVIQTLIGDLVLIYRCFIVYDRSWSVITPPLIVWTSTLVCGSIVLYISSHLRVSATVNEKHLVPFLTSTVALTMVQNLATTSLLAYKIWSIDRRITRYQSGSHRSKLKQLLRTVIESGAIYTLSVLLLLVTYLCSNNAQYAVSDCGVQIIGIVFNMIIIRVQEGRTAEQEFTRGLRGTSLSAGSTSAHSQPHNALAKPQIRTPTSGRYSMQPLQVNVSRQVLRDSEYGSPFTESKGNIEGRNWEAV